MVTVELAVGFVTATVLAATLAGVVHLGVAQAACARTSSEMARQLARGDGAAARSAQGEAPAAAVARVDSRADGVGVTVTVPVNIFGMGSFTVSSQNWAAWEPGVVDATQE